MASLIHPDKTMASPAIPFAVACMGIALFSAMDGVMKALSLEMGAYNALLWRTALATLIMIPVAIYNRQGWPSRTAWRLHLMRGSISAVMAFTFFWGIARVPLAEGIALSFISPIIALYLATVLLKEEIGGRTIAASVLGFAGVIVIASGRIGGDFSEDALWGIAAILVSSFFYAGNLVLMRMQSRVAGPTEIALIQSIVVGTILACFAPFFAIVPALTQAPMIGLAAILTIASLILLAWAYARAQAQHLLPVEYTSFIWASILGYLMFDEHVTFFTIAGTILIIAGCIIAARSKPA
jgi:S-adenosylmethionine uptake transporter